MIKKVQIFIIFLLVLSCTKDEMTSSFTDLGGDYKVISVKSDKALDLNNDGISSSDFYSEISDLHVTGDGTKIKFYDFEFIDKFMEIRPTELQNNNAQLISFKFPHQYINYLSDGTPFLSEYLNSFINYSYEISHNEIKLINGNFVDIEGVGEVNSLQVLRDNILKATITKNTFDFKTKSWIQVNIEVEYLKVEN